MRARELARSVRVVDAAVAVWAVAWLVAAVFVVQALRQLEDGGHAVVTAGEGLNETSFALERAARGLDETAGALGALDALPFVRGNPGAAVERTARDVDRFALRVRETGRDARVTGQSAAESARTLALVLGLAVALTPTLPVLALYLLARPLVRERLRA